MSARTESVAPSPAQWALARMLDAAFDDKEAANRCVEVALANAGRETIPESATDLLTFGQEYLCPVLAEELGPRIVQALFDDLCSELAQLRRSSLRVATAKPFKSSVPRLTVPPITEVPRSLPTIHSPAPNDDVTARKVIALVERDRWTRASIARVLVQSGFDVLPLDSTDELLQARVDAIVFVGEAKGDQPRSVVLPREASSAQIAEAVRRVL